MTPDIITINEDELCTRPFADVFAEALRGVGCWVQTAGEQPKSLPVHTWNDADDSDHRMLQGCVGPVLDVGCGPGRMTEALVNTGTEAMGIDVVPEAVEFTRARGVHALEINVFDTVPGEGTWGTVLLADGNIGIQGDPVRLLRRCAELLRPGGHVVAEVCAPGTGLEVYWAQLKTSTTQTKPFKWAYVGTDAIAGVAQQAGLGNVRVHRSDERWYAYLERAAT